MVRDYYSIQELVDIFDIEVISAKELLEGVIDFEPEELYELALHKDISIENLIA